MNIIYYLFPISLFLGVVFIGLFVWATLKGQYDDMETPALKILLEDNNITNNKKEDQK